MEIYEPVTRRTALKWMAAASLAVGGVALGGCSSGSSGSSAKGSDGSGAKKTESFDLAISAFPTLWRNVPWMIAAQQNLWSKHGLKVGYVSSNGGGETYRSMSLGDLPYADGSLAAVVSAQAAGVPLEVLGVMARYAGTEGLYVQLPSGTVKSPSDLAGKRMAYTNPGAGSQIVNELIAAKAGLQGKVKMVALGSNDNYLSGLQRGLVDLIPAVASAVELLVQGKLKVAFSIPDVLPYYVDTCQVGSQEVINKNPELIRTIMAVRDEAVQYVLNNISVAEQLFAKQGDQALSAVRYNTKTIASMSDYFSPTFHVEFLTDIQAGMLYAGALPKGSDNKPAPIAWPQVINQRFLPASERASIPATIPLPA